MEWKNAGVLSVLTYAALAGGCAATSTSDDTTPAEAPTGSAQTTPAAQQEFWTAIHAADYANVDAIIKDLQADFDTTPQDSRRAEFVGLADVWAASESYRNPATAPQVQMTHDASQSLQTAVKLDPTNYFAAAFLGVGMVDEGRATKNDALATQGWNLIEQATADRPTFAGIIKLFGTRTFAASDPRVQEAIEGMWAGFDACIGGKLDRTNPDYTPYYAVVKKPGTDRFCANDDLAPHALEGLFLYMGDALVKVGQVDVAKVFYQNAKGVDVYGSWQHAKVIDARLGADLNGRAAAYKDPNPMMWPPLGDGAYTCTVCHGSTGL